MNTRILRQYARILLGTAALIALGACGGGDGDSNLSGGITYTGNANPAILTTANGADLITGAYTAGANGSSIGSVAGTLDAPESGGTAPARPFALYQSLNALMARLSPAAVSASSTARAVQSRSETLPSEEGCGGNLTPTGNAQISFSYDDVTGDFDGSAVFNAYCAEGESLSGSATLSGRINVATSDFISMTISTHNLTVISGSDNYTINGEVSVDPGASSQTVNMDLLIQDNISGKTVWLNNFTLTVTAGIDSELISAHGRYYNPDEGYVILATPSPLQIMHVDDWPSSGSLTVTGANGKATLTALSNTVYRVDVDLGDDGSVESTVTGNWADL